MRTSSTTTRGGFTLLELLLVILLIGLLFGVATPYAMRSFGPAKLVESAERFKTLIALCRAQAMSDGRDYRIEFRADGTIRVRRQLHPLSAPQTFVEVPYTWADTQVLMDDVWVEAFVSMPEGPPPLDVESDEIAADTFGGVEDFELLEEVDDEQYELLAWGERDDEDVVAITFRPDGSSPSARWRMRDTRGRAFEMTLDGRLGRVAWEEAEGLPADEVVRPEPLSDDEDIEPDYEPDEVQEGLR